MTANRNDRIRLEEPGIVGKQQVPRLRCAPLGMTGLYGSRLNRLDGNQRHIFDKSNFLLHEWLGVLHTAEQSIEAG